MSGLALRIILMSKSTRNTQNQDRHLQTLQTVHAGQQQRPDVNRHEAAANQQTAAAPPTYTAVDKSKKKSKRKKEEKSPESSVVDKSQTKKQSDDTYAQVDKSKKL